MLTADWRENVLYFMNVQRGEAEKNRDQREISERSGVSGECRVQSEAEHKHAEAHSLAACPHQ